MSTRLNCLSESLIVGARSACYRGVLGELSEYFGLDSVPCLDLCSQISFFINL